MLLLTMTRLNLKNPVFYDGFKFVNQIRLAGTRDPVTLHTIVSLTPFLRFLRF